MERINIYNTESYIENKMSVCTKPLSPKESKV